DQVEESVQVNSMAPLNLMKEFVPAMNERGYGRVVNVSSGWGSLADGLAGPFSYSITKALLNAITLASARDTKGDVKINAACPGWVRTRMGGMMASRSAEQGAETIVWLCNLPSDGPNGGFFRDKKLVDW
ncbi:MAG: SDR family NAD(P)-dependent oxidoreductase, partial [Pseudomonadota bacterium]